MTVLSPRRRLSIDRLRADPAPLVADEERPAMGRLCTWNLGVLAEEARALSNGLMFWDAEPSLDLEAFKRLALGRGKPLGKEDGFF